MLKLHVTDTINVYPAKLYRAVLVVDTVYCLYGILLRYLYPLVILMNDSKFSKENLKVINAPRL